MLYNLYYLHLTKSATIYYQIMWCKPFIITNHVKSTNYLDNLPQNYERWKGCQLKRNLISKIKRRLWCNLSQLFFITKNKCHLNILLTFTESCLLLFKLLNFILKFQFLLKFHFKESKPLQTTSKPVFCHLKKKLLIWYLLLYKSCGLHLEQASQSEIPKWRRIVSHKKT